jgi:3-methyladenine DNA glycosylase AlkD
LYNNEMSLVSARTITNSLKSHASTDKTKILGRFFKTGKGQYGEGDKFMGIVVPDVRRVSKEYYKQVTLSTIEQLIRSPYHEVRLCGLIMLVYKYQHIEQPSLRGSAVLRRAQDDTAETKQSHDKPLLKKDIFDFYLSHTKHINNWDLVDLTAPNIVGDYLLNIKSSSSGLTRGSTPPILPQHRVLLAPYPTGEPRRLRKTGVLGRSHPACPDCLGELVEGSLSPVLIKLAKSSSLWERRIAMISTFAFICAGRHQEAFAIAEILLHDKHDLIHKAVGWMLREVGKRIGKDRLREFLDKYASTMPRTTLRYAIEHLSENERKHYMIFKTV